MKNKNVIDWEKFVSGGFPKFKTISGNADWIFELLGWKKQGKTRSNR